MDARLFRSVNHLADRTGWLHPYARGFAVHGIVALAGLLLGAGIAAAGAAPAMRLLRPLAARLDDTALAGLVRPSPAAAARG